MPKIEILDAPEDRVVTIRLVTDDGRIDDVPAIIDEVGRHLGFLGEPVVELQVPGQLSETGRYLVLAVETLVDLEGGHVVRVVS